MRTTTLLLALALLSFAPTAHAATEVKVLGGTYSPDVIEVAAGEAITWINEDAAAHTVTSTWDGGETFDAVLRGGETFVWTFDEPGEYAIHCRPHAYPNDETDEMEGMVMRVSVTSADAGAEIAAPLSKIPAPALPLVILAALGATMLLRRLRS